MKYTASFYDGPIGNTTRAVEDDREFVRVDSFVPPRHPTPDEPSTFVEAQHHVYELQALRLVLGESTHLFYSYIGVAGEGEIF